MSREEILKQNLLRFIMYNMTERCDNFVHELIDDTVRDGECTLQTVGKIRVENNQKEVYLFKVSLKKVDTIDKNSI